MNPSGNSQVNHPLSSACENFLDDILIMDNVFDVKWNVHFEAIPPTSNIEAIPTQTEQLPPIVSVSTTFNTTSDYGDGCWDMILVSSDAVHFYVRISRLLDASTSYFDSLLLPFLDQDVRVAPPCIKLSEDVQVLDIVLRVIYSIAFLQPAAVLGTLLNVIKALHKYGIPLDTHAVPGTMLFDGIAVQTHQDAVEVYVLAAKHDLFEMACIASEHLLRLPLVFLPDEMISQLGTAYLHMLYSLHLGRVYLLQRILASPPQCHESTPLCGLSQRQVLQSAWHKVIHRFTNIANPDISTTQIRDALAPLVALSPCVACQNLVQQRIDEAVLRWSRTPRRISRDMREFYALSLPST